MEKSSNFTGIYGMFVVGILTYLMMFTDAGLICEKKILHNEVGLCNNTTGIVHLWHCRQCPPRLGLSIKCGEMYEIGTEINQCVPCKKGLEYSDKNDNRQCEPCRRCLENEVVHGKCKPDGDTISCTCKEGYYRDTSSRYCMPCSWCCGDGSNKAVPECKNLEKKCSLRSGKSCAPTTPAPTTVTTTAGAISSTTNPDTTENMKTVKSRAPTTPAPTTVTTTAGAISSTTNSSSKDPPKGKTAIIYIASCSSIALFLLVLSTLLCLRIHYLRRKQQLAQPLLPRSHRYNIDDRFRTQEQVYLHVHPDDAFAVYHVGRPQAQPLLPRNHRNNIGDRPRNEEHVDLDPHGAVAVYHVGTPPVPQGPNGVEPTQANGTRLNEQQLRFIIEKLGTKIADLKQDVMQKLSLMLNVKCNGKDYRNLDCFCDLNVYEIKWLEERENPMKHIIDIMVGKSITLESFLNELYRISRGDVVQQLHEIATKVKSN